MQVTLIIVGVVVMVLGILRHRKIHAIPRLGYQLIEFPGYLIIILGVLLILSGVFLL